VNKNRKEFIIK